MVEDIRRWYTSCGKKQRYMEGIRSVGLGRNCSLKYGGQDKIH